MRGIIIQVFFQIVAFSLQTDGSASSDKRKAPLRKSTLHMIRIFHCLLFVNIMAIMCWMQFLGRSSEPPTSQTHSNLSDAEIFSQLLGGQSPFSPNTNRIYTRTAFGNGTAIRPREISFNERKKRLCSPVKAHTSASEDLVSEPTDEMEKRNAEKGSEGSHNPSEGPSQER